MTKKEALELERCCNNELSKETGKNCIASMTLNGNLKIQFGKNSISFNRRYLYSPEWVDYAGDYDELQSFIGLALDVIRENNEMFKMLMWCYENVRELKG